MTGEMHTDTLFEKYTINEIREIEKKTKQDIEKKREELRQMVGERYRDLIEAADTITEMKESAQNVMNSISHMQKMFVDQRVMSTAASVAKKRDDSQFYSDVSQMKLIMDIPEQIWSCIECGTLLRATRLYLLARHAHNCLQMAPQHAAYIHTRFPVLARQWLAVSHFHDTILTICRNMLKSCTSSDQVTAECLCSLLLLEDSTPRQVFNEYLLTRTHAVQQLCDEARSTTSVKAQVCAVTLIIITTVHQICAIFYPGEDGAPDDADTLGDSFNRNLLMRTLKSVTEDGSADDIFNGVSSVSKKYLPKTVIEFRPLLLQNASAISAENININCRQWVKTCVVDVSAGVKKLLSYVTSIRGLASIRDDIWNLLMTDDKMSTWDAVCQCVLSQKLPLWDHFFQQMFVDRTKVLLQNQVDEATAACKVKVTRVLSDLADRTNKSLLAERDLSTYIWAETRQDLPANVSWLSGDRKASSPGGALLMKAHAHTPAIQRLCAVLDTRLRLLLEDVSRYVGGGDGGGGSGPLPGPPPGPLPGPLPGGGEGGAEPFDRFADHREVEAALEAACTRSVRQILDHLSLQLDETKAARQAGDDATASAIYIHRLLLLARFSAATCQLCPHLQRCVEANATTDQSNSAESSARLPKSGRSQRKSTECVAWTELKVLLQNFSQQLFNVWSSYVCSHLIAEFTRSVLDTSSRSVLLGCMRWDDIEIKEETETGAAVTSTIHIPLQPCWYLQSLLYSVCEQINSVGSHVINRATLQNIVTEISDGILSAYERLLVGDEEGGERDASSSSSARLNQTRALQLLYDVRFTAMVLFRRADSEADQQYAERLSRLIERIETFIDPFDFDVFAPFLQERLTRQLQRCQVLYGALLQQGRLSPLGAAIPRSTLLTSLQEQHNVLPLAASRGRFPQLPLSAGLRPLPATTRPPVVQAPQAKFGMLAPLSPPPAPGAVPEGSGDEAPSFLGQMSTIWFSNVGTGRPK